MLREIVKRFSNSLPVFRPKDYPISLSGFEASSLSLFLAGRAEEEPLLVVAEDAEQAGYLYSDLVQVLGEERVMMFPSSYRREIRYGHKDDAKGLLRSMLLATISRERAIGQALPLIVSYPKAIIEQVPAPQVRCDDVLQLVLGQECSPQAIISQLIEWGYECCDYVYELGQYAQRGNILDIYSYSSEYPYRIVFFDDEIESLRTFEVESQLTKQTLEAITLSSNLSEVVEVGVSFFSRLPQEVRVVMPDADTVIGVATQTWETAPTINDGEGFDSLEAIRAKLISPEELQADLSTRACIYYRSAIQSESKYTCDIELQPLWGKNYDDFCTSLEIWQAEGYQIYLLTAQEQQYSRITEIIAEHRAGLQPPKHLKAVLHEGFIVPSLSLVLLTEHQLFGRYHRYSLRSDKARSGKITRSLKDLKAFNVGDLVVHLDHGIGRFGGLVMIDKEGKREECLKIEYVKGAIFVGLQGLHKLSLYRQEADAKGVVLSTLGTGAWQRIKERTKKQIKNIARDLIKLYANRRDSVGFAYSQDTYLQHELEASFPYIDTPDQVKAIEAIKVDMERPYPMDRLLCGDVGFGKTEVAIRAAFKAVADGKQVAVLVPTTVLAHQHYRTFSERLKDFPVTIEYMSRVKKTTAIKQTLAALKSGAIDIIIGTHKLTNKEVQFKDLGLLIIDEEQKFGVRIKELLRQMQVNVDTLTMSATPIPRTLQFSIMGVRDLSNLNTPPENRVPVETILTRFSPQVISEAINFELSRNGQVYVVHNRIDNIEQVAEIIRREIPEARVAVGHGQLPPAQLESILVDFGNHDYDVLVATTIIENGIDVPNANTIIVNDAHKYGLSALHQLRGRVGRSSRKAFCYLLSPPISVLGDASRRRLRAIESFSDLGSGIRVALQDLDIRGAGNALGAEQSGFVSDMGYETYQRVFNEAVRELKYEEFTNLYQEEQERTGDGGFAIETQVETDLELRLPEDYVPTDAERIILYRELDDLVSEEDLQAYRERLVDRFGTPPPIVEALISVPRLRRLARNCGFEKVILKQGKMTLYLPKSEDSPYYSSRRPEALFVFVTKHSKRCLYREYSGRKILSIGDVGSVSQAVELMQIIYSTEV